MEEAPQEIPEEAEGHEEVEAPTDEVLPPVPATPPPAPTDAPEVTPEKPKAKARGRPKGSTNKNTYQALAERLDQMDARLAERDQRVQRAPSPRRGALPSSADEEAARSVLLRRGAAVLPNSAEEAAAHFISQIGIQAEERRCQRLEVYRSFLPQ